MVQRALACGFVLGAGAVVAEGSWLHLTVYGPPARCLPEPPSENLWASGPALPHDDLLGAMVVGVVRGKADIRFSSWPPFLTCQ